MGVPGKPYGSTHPDDGSRDERWWENSPLASESFSYETFDDGVLAELKGEIVNALNLGIREILWRRTAEILRLSFELSEMERRAFVMHAIDGESFRQIGRELGVHHVTARRAYERAAGKLRWGNHWIRS